MANTGIEIQNGLLLEVIENIFSRQLDYQTLHKVFPKVEDPEEKLRLTEAYVLKLIEEAVELRKCFPSSFNKHERSKAELHMVSVYAELADILLFLVNICLVWDIDFATLLMAVKFKQQSNFTMILEKLNGDNTNETDKTN